MSMQKQLRRSVVIAKKDVWIYYSKGPVIVFGLLFPSSSFWPSPSEETSPSMSYFRG
jgi:hypothetical protein